MLCFICGYAWSFFCSSMSVVYSRNRAICMHLIVHTLSFADSFHCVLMHVYTQADTWHGMENIVIAQRIGCFGKWFCKPRTCSTRVQFKYFLCKFHFHMRLHQKIYSHIAITEQERERENERELLPFQIYANVRKYFSCQPNRCK